LPFSQQITNINQQPQMGLINRKIILHPSQILKKSTNITFKQDPLRTPYPIDNIQLSLVIPAYNEQNRLPIALEQTVNFFKYKNVTFEVIIINDGSKDKTWETIEKSIAKYKDIDIIGVNFAKNGGKGHAVTHGMRYARGEYILMLDADGATDLNNYNDLKRELEGVKKDNLGIAIGSRNHLVEKVVAEVSIVS
jgi:dolichyl-phosphate beta-glucosyltransferase